MLLNSFVIGRTMVLMPKWDPGEALRLIEAEKITYFVGVPTMSLELMQHPDRDSYDLSSADRHRRRRRAAPGRARRPARGRASRARSRRSATASPRPMRRAAAISGPIITTSRPRPGGRRSRSSSSPYWARATRHLPAGERGEVAIRSASNIRGYWNDEAATARRLHRRRLPQDRRHRLSRRGRLSVHRRPQEGHHHPRRREYQRPGGRGGDLRPSGGVRGGGVRGAPTSGSARSRRRWSGASRAGSTPGR